MSTDVVRTYITACNREHAECAQELVDALNGSAKVAQLGQRAVPLNDIDICCIAEAIRALKPDNALKVLNLEGNSFGLQGVQALMDAIESNPGHIKELRLGKNNLKDQAAVAIGHTLSRNGCGLKVLDLSENGITKLGVIPIASAIQDPSSDIVELSFHNNKIECDAAVFLGQAIRAAPRLKHLHLGYNTLRDSGASQLAKNLPHAKCLSTLDLTANRVGHEGGMEIARALMAPACTVQRLNLRHNLLGSEAIAAFAKVLHVNRSLIQLFLGFMNPTPEVAAEVLGAAKDNASLLLLDIYGWKLDPQYALSLVRSVQEGTGAIAAIVTDACQTIATAVDEGNIIRENHNRHPIYVGPDDRDAYLATKSLRRYSRAQSRRQSRVPSARASRARSDRESSRISRTNSRRRLEGDDEGTHAGSYSASRRHSRHSSRRHSRRSSRNISERRGHDAVSGEGGKSAENGVLAAAPQRTSSRHSRRSAKRSSRSPQNGESARARSPKSVPRSASQSAREVVSDGPERQREVDRLLDALLESPCDTHTAGAIAAIVKALQSQMRQQRAKGKREVRELTARIEALERRRECHCVTVPGGSVSRSSAINVSAPNSGGVHGCQHSAPAAPFVRSNSGMGSSGYYGSGGSQYQQQPASANRSISRMSEGGGYERAMTPLVHPNSEIRDILPDLPRPNDESGDRKPEETSLQRSASVQNFPPRIEPSPAQDSNPPRRKSVSHNF